MWETGGGPIPWREKRWWPLSGTFEKQGHWPLSVGPPQALLMNSAPPIPTATSVTVLETPWLTGVRQDREHRQTLGTRGPHEHMCTVTQDLWLVWGHSGSKCQGEDIGGTLPPD